MTNWLQKIEEQGGIVARTAETKKRFLVASDFDQTLSFNDSGVVLAQMLGVTSFDEKVAGLSKMSLVQQGAELAYLLRHDPEFRRVRKEHLIEAGKHIRLKKNIERLVETLNSDIDGHEFTFYVISAGPRDVVQSALEGIVPPSRIHGTEFDFDPVSGEISSVVRASAGYGKVAVLQELQARLSIGSEQTIYMGDGSSDMYVMQHLNHREGFTIAVSESKDITRIARRTVLSDNALSVLVPILEDVLHWGPLKIREYFNSFGLSLVEWDKTRTDWLSFSEPAVGARTSAV